MREVGLNQSALAREIQVDRSTISQLLNSETARLPNAHVVAECAVALGVSGDWLLGLSDHPEHADQILATSLQVSDAPRALVDDQINGWHAEAQGYKIRHVPAALPDLLKTPDMLRWEYEEHLGRSVKQAINASEERLNLINDNQSDFEIALPLYEVETFASSTGYYRGLPSDIRNGQIAHILDLHDRLYPSLRVFLFDAHRLWSAPLTIFGPLVAALYIGSHYLTFRDRERVRLLTRQFDGLVREAHISARQWPDHLQALSASSNG